MQSLGLGEWAAGIVGVVAHLEYRYGVYMVCVWVIIGTYTATLLASISSCMPSHQGSRLEWRCAPTCHKFINVHGDMNIYVCVCV
ncbi:hypothetical protein EON63_01750 [archaeon]|nr:MAG: hypothetical protein EON63_01750 [archaeon]